MCLGRLIRSRLLNLTWICRDCKVRREPVLITRARLKIVPNWRQRRAWSMAMHGITAMIPCSIFTKPNVVVSHPVQMVVFRSAVPRVNKAQQDQPVRRGPLARRDLRIVQRKLLQPQQQLTQRGALKSFRKTALKLKHML